MHCLINQIVWLVIHNITRQPKFYIDIPLAKNIMIKNIKLDGKIVHFELFFPNEIKEFLSKNNIDENELLNNENWTDYIIEDLEQYKIIDFEKAKIVINYIHIDQNNQIRVNPENIKKEKP